MIEDLESVSEKEAARLLNVAVVTMRQWRRPPKGRRPHTKGPAHFELPGGSIRYRVNELRRWQASREKC